MHSAAQWSSLRCHTAAFAPSSPRGTALHHSLRAKACGPRGARLYTDAFVCEKAIPRELFKEEKNNPNQSSSPNHKISPPIRPRLECLRRRRRRRQQSKAVRSALQAAQVGAVQIAYQPARATGIAYTHPVAAVTSVGCDLLQMVIAYLPPGHAHAIVALALHLLSDMLLASPY